MCLWNNQVKLILIVTLAWHPESVSPCRVNKHCECGELGSTFIKPTASSGQCRAISQPCRQKLRRLGGRSPMVRICFWAMLMVWCCPPRFAPRPVSSLARLTYCQLCQQANPTMVSVAMTDTSFAEARCDALLPMPNRHLLQACSSASQSTPAPQAGQLWWMTFLALMGNPFVWLKHFEGVCFAFTGRVLRNTPEKMILEGISRPNLEHFYAN